MIRKEIGYLHFFFDGDAVSESLLNAKNEYNLTTYAFNRLSDYYVIKDVKLLAYQFFNSEYAVTSYTLSGRLYFVDFSFLRGNVRLKYRNRSLYDVFMIYSIVLMPIVMIKDGLLLSGKIGNRTYSKGRCDNQ